MLAVVLAAALVATVGGGSVAFGHGAASGIEYGTLAGLSYALSFGLAAVVMARMLEQHRSFEMIALVTAATMLVVGTVAAVFWPGRRMRCSPVSRMH